MLLVRFYFICILIKSITYFCFLFFFFLFLNPLVQALGTVGNQTEFSTCEKQKNRENTRQRKQSHTQDNIYVVRQFAYIHRVAGISLLSGKNTEYKMQLQSFILSISKNAATTQHKTLKLESRFHKNGLNGPKNFFSRGRCPQTPKGLSMSAPTWVCWPKPPLHGLSLSKSSIKNHATLFGSGQVVKPDQTKLGSTKPNRYEVFICLYWPFTMNSILHIVSFK